MTQLALSPAQLQAWYLRLQEMRMERLFSVLRRPANLKRAASSSVSDLTMLSVADRLQARQLAEILAGAYRGLGLDHYTPK